MKCPACGFEHGSEVDANQLLCNAWAYSYSINKRLPTKEQYEAMQKRGFLPTHGEIDGRTFELRYSDCGWANHDWPSIAAKITQKVLQQVA
jgi:hypothetical protein